MKIRMQLALLVIFTIKTAYAQDYKLDNKLFKRYHGMSFSIV